MNYLTQKLNQLKIRAMVFCNLKPDSWFFQFNCINCNYLRPP
jgi:hypothetical protein